MSKTAKTVVHNVQCFVRHRKVLLGQCWQQSAQYWVPVPPSLVGYWNKRSEKSVQKEVLLSEVWRSRWLKATPNIVLTKFSWSGGPSPHHSETSSPFIFFHQRNELGSEDFDTVAYCYQSVYCCLIGHLLVKVSIAKCFTYSSKRFHCKVMAENEHTFFSLIHCVRKCTVFTQMARAAA